MDGKQWDVVIVGGGAAGLSAALILGRARRRVLVIDSGSPRNRFAEHMHGVLGHEGIDPAELLRRGRAEATGYGVEFVHGTVDRVTREPDGLALTTAEGLAESARALIVATGLSDDLPEVPGLAERWGKSVLHCPYCHGWEVRDRRLGVLTTSPLGMHQAELIRQWSDRVVVFTAGLGELSPEAEQRLRARGVELVPEPVTEVLGEGTAISAVRVESGREVPVDAVFTAGVLRPRDGFLAGLELERTETPMGSFLAVDGTGRTSDERVWAVGNVANPGANVPISIGAATMAAAVVNAALVGWDFDAAVAGGTDRQGVAPADFWEERYATAERVWSGRVNRVLSEVAATLTPGRALDLGCGEGADVVWLARHGWDATGIDISPTAIRRATEAARAAGVDAGRIRFVAADLATLPEGTYDLVTASFLHSPVELPREAILRRAAERVAPGGHLLITSHAAPPPWARAHEADAHRADAHRCDDDPGDGHRFLGPDEQLRQLALDGEAWDVVVAETRAREATEPDGQTATLEDVVILARRR